jgi:hypothetical protein
LLEIPSIANGFSVAAVGPLGRAVKMPFVQIPEQVAIVSDGEDCTLSTGEDLLEIPTVTDGFSVAAIGPLGRAVKVSFMAIPEQVAIVRYGVNDITHAWSLLGMYRTHLISPYGQKQFIG